MSRFWSETTRRLTPYVPGEQPKLNKLIKLNTNENPYGPSSRALEAIRSATGDALRLYPDPNSDALKAAIAARYGLEPAQVFIGNGSDEVLAHAFLGLLKHDAPLLFPDITYSFYPVYCGLYDVAHETVPLTAAFEIDPEDYLPRADRPIGAVIFPNPNAPTGRLLPLAAIERILAANPEAVVLVDEAYIDFGGATAVPLIARYPNLLVTQTLSKSRSLAGIRVGFAVGHPDLIDALERVKNSFNSYPLDRLAQVAAVAAIADEEHFDATRTRIIATRDRLSAQLTDLGFDVLPSHANFVFARHPHRDADALAAGLRETGIIVRHFKQARIYQYLRITVGTDPECAALIERLAVLLAG